MAPASGSNSTPAGDCDIVKLRLLAIGNLARLNPLPGCREVDLSMPCSSLAVIGQIRARPRFRRRAG